MLRPWDVTRLIIAHIRLIIIKNNAVLHRKIPRNGNYCERSNVGTEHARDSSYYKIISTVYTSKQLLHSQSWKKQGFFYGNHQASF